jgi:Dirigent-like protein
MAKLILKLVIASVGNRDFPAPPLTPPNNPNNIGSVNVFTDDITEINGDTSLRGQHSGFCFQVRQPNFWLCQAVYTLPGIRKRRFRHGGQIEARGRLDFSTQLHTVAITGGTDDYRRATGHVKIDGNDYTLTIYTP